MINALLLSIGGLDSSEGRIQGHIAKVDEMHDERFRSSALGPRVEFLVFPTALVGATLDQWISSHFFLEWFSMKPNFTLIKLSLTFGWNLKRKKERNHSIVKNVCTFLGLFLLLLYMSSLVYSFFFIVHQFVWKAFLYWHCCLPKQTISNEFLPEYLY